MSAVNIYCTESSAYVFTDGAIYDAEHKLLAVERKVYEVPGRRMVISSRGPALIGEAFAKYLTDSECTFDEFVLNGERMIQGYLDSLPRELDPENGGQFDLFVTGWSEREQRPLIMQYTNVHYDDVLPYQNVNSVMAPEIPEEELNAIGKQMGHYRSIEEVDPIWFGKAVLEVQRRIPGVLRFDAEGVYCIGGHILMTTVTASGISHEVVHTWPDQIGEPISPISRSGDYLGPLPTIQAGMNRAERRRIEKMHAKRDERTKRAAGR